MAAVTGARPGGGRPASAARPARIAPAPSPRARPAPRSTRRSSSRDRPLVGLLAPGGDRDGAAGPRRGAPSRCSRRRRRRGSSTSIPTPSAAETTATTRSSSASASRRPSRAARRAAALIVCAARPRACSSRPRSGRWLGRGEPCPSSRSRSSPSSTLALGAAACAGAAPHRARARPLAARGAPPGRRRALRAQPRRPLLPPAPRRRRAACSRRCSCTAASPPRSRPRPSPPCSSLAAAAPALPAGASSRGSATTPCSRRSRWAASSSCPRRPRSSLALSGAARLDARSPSASRARSRGVGVPAAHPALQRDRAAPLFALRQRVHDLAAQVGRLPLGHARGEPRLLPHPGPRASSSSTRSPSTSPCAAAGPARRALDGAFTHQGDWRHAFDFEVRDADGRLAARARARANERLPLLPPPGARRGGRHGGRRRERRARQRGGRASIVERNWGNHVLVQHGAGLYSLVAHLAARLGEGGDGQLVRRGEVLGLVRQLGAIAAAAPALPPPGHARARRRRRSPAASPTWSSLEDGRGARWRRPLAPGEGDVVREPRARRRPRLRASPSSTADTWAFRAGRAIERVACDVDLYGRTARPLARSPGHALLRAGATPSSPPTTCSARRDRCSTCSARRSRACRSRRRRGGSRWTDHLPARPFRPWLGRVLLRSPLALPAAGRDRDGASACAATGRSSSSRGRRGAATAGARRSCGRGPSWRAGVGPVRVEVTVRGRARAAERVLSSRVSDSSDQGGMAS